MFRNLLSSHRGIKFSLIELVEAARYGIIFPLHYKHEWTLSYTYRVLISPIDKSLEQWNDKTKQNTKISMCEQYLRCGVAFLRYYVAKAGQILLSATLWCGRATPWRGPTLLRRDPYAAA